MISLVPVPWSRYPHCACGVGEPNCRKFLWMSLIVRSLHSAASAIEAKVNISKDNRHSWIVTYMGHSQPPEGPIPDTTIRSMQLGQRQCRLRLGITCWKLSRSLIWETICVPLGNYAPDGTGNWDGMRSLHLATNPPTHRTIGPGSIAAFCIDKSKMREGDRAYICMFRDENTYNGIHQDEDNVKLAYIDGVMTGPICARRFCEWLVCGSGLGVPLARFCWSRDVPKR